MPFTLTAIQFPLLPVFVTDVPAETDVSTFEELFGFARTFTPSVVVREQKLQGASKKVEEKKVLPYDSFV